MRFILIIYFVLLFTGCSFPLSYYEVESENQNDEIQTFSNNTIGNFKNMVDEGWKISVQNNELIFIRRTEAGVEIFKPTK